MANTSTFSIPSRQLSSKRDELRSVAIHEAGHAVIARVLNVLCGGASIVADKDSAGHAIIADAQETATAWHKDFQEKLRLGKRARYRDASLAYRYTGMAWMAGAEAERDFTGVESVSDGHDRYWAEEALRNICDSDLELERTECRLRKRTTELVERHRKRIEVVAMLLWSRQTLTADEIDDLSCLKRHPNYGLWEE